MNIINVSVRTYSADGINRVTPKRYQIIIIQTFVLFRMIITGSARMNILVWADIRGVKV